MIYIKRRYEDFNEDEQGIKKIKCCEIILWT